MALDVTLNSGKYIFPVVLSGGSGTRLWPMSRSTYPKQFIRGLDGGKTSLLGAALQRVSPERGFMPPIILTNADYRFLVEEEVAEAGIRDAQIVLEPVQRNTAPAVAVAALLALRASSDALIVVMPSDHAIRDSERFGRAVEAASDLAAKRRHVLFGVTPATAHTGYGYIRRGPRHADFDGAFEVDRFLEKPAAAKAQEYLDSGEYFWNSGIFVLHAQTFFDEFAELMPDGAQAVQEAVDGGRMDLGFLRLDSAAFQRAPNISIDYAVMERTTRASVIPLDVGWSDVGSWSSLHDITEHDSGGNHFSDNVIAHETANCFVRSTRNVVATLGVKDLVIVDTPDALLVADRARSQEVGGIIDQVKRAGRKEHEQHVRSYRPWGFFETLSLGDRFQVKRLHVKVGGKLSLQMHHHRSEHWVVVQGTAKVTIDNVEKLLRENESIFISATQWHRLENTGKVPVEIIEVQNGAYLGEDDIVRSEDIYGRIS